MASRIPQDFIDQLLDRVDIVDLIDSFLPLKKAGNNYKACCPFHGEKTPSFTVSREKQFYHCFGCGAHGTAISWLMEHDHQEFRDAVETLAGQAGMEVPNDNSDYQKTNHKIDGIDLYKLASEVAQFYAQQLKTHPASAPAKQYLKNRGLTGEIAKAYQIGFTPDAWDTILKQFGNEARHQKALTQIGLLSKNEKGRIYDRFRNRIIFPIVDFRGRTVGFGGRVIDNSEPKYLNSPETPIFHKGSELYGLYSAMGEIRKQSQAIVVEGYMDVVSLAQYGIDISIAALGTALTRTNIERLFRSTQRFTICFDGDRAGIQAAERALENALPLMQDGREIKFLFLPQGEDPDSMVRKIGKDEFMNLVEQATPLSDFLIQQLQGDINLDTMEGRAKFASLGKQQLTKLPNSILKSLLVEQLTRMSEVAPEQLASPPQKATNQKFDKRPVTRQQGKMQPVSKTRQAITLLLRNPELNRIAGDIHLLTQNSNNRGSQLLAELIQTCRDNPELTTASLIERFRWHADFAALIKLSSVEIFEIEIEARQDKFVALIKSIQDDQNERHQQININQLLEKPFSTLNDEEKQRVRTFYSK